MGSVMATVVSGTKHDLADEKNDNTNSVVTTVVTKAASNNTTLRFTWPTDMGTNIKEK